MSIEEQFTEIRRAVSEARNWLNAVEALCNQLERREGRTLELVAKAFEAASTRESERAALVAEVGECCMGVDPYCYGECLVEKALKKRRAALSASGETT